MLYSVQFQGKTKGVNVKAKISTSAGTFEFEGSEEFIEKQIAAVLAIVPQQPTAVQTQKKTVKQSSGTKQSSSKSVTQPRMLATLLSSKDEIDSLRAYFDEKRPFTHIGTFAVLTLWLRNNKGMKDSSVDEIWTLYKVLNMRPPKSLIQTFRDGKSKKSFFESSDQSGRYFITSYGETFVDHDLPPAADTKEGK